MHLPPCCFLSISCTEPSASHWPIKLQEQDATLAVIWELGSRIVFRQAQTHNALLGNKMWIENSKMILYTIRKFPTKLPGQPWYRWGWKAGQREDELKLKPQMTQRRRGCQRWEYRQVPWSLLFFLERISFSVSPSWPCLYPSADSVYVLAWLKAASQAGRRPTLIGMCHSAEGKRNRWPPLATPAPPALINTFICILSPGCGLSLCIRPL